MNNKAYEFDRNPKSAALIDAVLNNEADYNNKDNSSDRPLGKYQTGFSVTYQASRGAGKTYTLLDIVAISAFQLPRALAAVGSRTFKQVQEIILSQSTKVWEKWRLTEYDSKNNRFGNYVVNKRPPEHFAKPYTAPKTYDNTVSFANGYAVQAVSADREDTQRGLNLDQYFGDESAFQKRSFFSKTISPAIRANKYCFHDPRPHRKGYNHPLHWLKMQFSSAPYSPEGLWIYENEERMNNEIKLKGGYKNYFYLEATAYDNLKFLPGDFISEQKANLTDFEFDVEIMNKRVRKAQNAFYPSFSEEKHVKDYYAYNFDDKEFRTDIKQEAYDVWKPLEMSWDFNGYFTCCVVAQDFNKEFRFIKEFWAKESDSTLIAKVCDDFVNHYKNHLKKVVYLYGDSGGNQRSPGENFFNDIKMRLRIAGFMIIDCLDNTYPSFASRYKVINGLLSEEKPSLPKIRFNADACKSLIVSIMNTQTQKDSFEKNKANEGNLRIAQETVTHLSDAFDYILYKKFSQFVETSSARGGMIRLSKS
jgi:hypothetical protein